MWRAIEDAMLLLEPRTYVVRQINVPLQLEEMSMTAKIECMLGKSSIHIYEHDA
jgi:hypothetical protein